MAKWLSRFHYSTNLRFERCPNSNRRLGTASGIIRNPTRPVKVGSVTIGGGHPIVVQSMCATKTADVEATVAQVDQLAARRGGRGPDRRRHATRLPGPGRNPPPHRPPTSPSISRKTTGWRPRWPRWSTRSATTRAICTITSATALGRTRSGSWSTWPASTTVRCGWA